jgi:hypothetical protein
MKRIKIYISLTLVFLMCDFLADLLCIYLFQFNGSSVGISSAACFYGPIIICMTSENILEIDKQ